jgi:hypothetical protein
LCVQRGYVAHFDVDISRRGWMIGSRGDVLLVDGLFGIIAVHV